jgi:hypothetical protein
VKINRCAVVAVSAAALLGTLTACGGGAKDDSVNPEKAVSSPPSSVAPSTAGNKLLTREEGARKYEEIVKPFNATAFDKCWKVVGPIYDASESSPDDFPKIRKACGDVGKANRRFANDLEALKWPAEAQASVDKLVDEIRADQMAWDELAKVRQHDDLFNPEHPFQQEEGTGADLVRAHLGLPPREEG